MSESPKIQSFVLDSTIESVPASKILSEQLTEELTKVFRKVPNACGLIIISHDFKLPLNHATIEMKPTSELFNLMKQKNTLVMMSLLEKSSMSMNHSFSEQFSEKVKNISRMSKKGYRILILPYDFELALKEASHIVNTTPKILELMLENSGIISAGRTVKVHKLLKFMKQWSDQKKKSFEEFVEYTGHLFGTD